MFVGEMQMNTDFYANITLFLRDLLKFETLNTCTCTGKND